MLTKGFAKFVWEENVEELKMPHFYLGKHSLSTFLFLTLKFVFLAFIFLGIGSAISIIVFCCEKLFVKKNLFY